MLALWLPHLPAERREAATPTRPFAVWAAAGNRRLIVAANRAARQAGIVAGQTLADARAVAGDFAAEPADAAADARRLRRLAAWCRRYAPWTAPIRGQSGLWLETGGAAHLFGGEAAMCRAVLKDFARAGHEARAGLAGTPGAAWALARAAGIAPMSRAASVSPVIAPPGAERDALAPLPVAALRLDAAIADGLGALGLRRIGDLYPLAADGAGRAGLARRFPPLLLARLDAALGHSFEPIAPERERTRHIARLALPEPVHEPEVIARLARRLAATLCDALSRDGLGARRIRLTAFRADGQTARIAVGTARPLADAAALMRLLALRLAHLDAGPGADTFTLEATAAEPLGATQARFGGTAVDADDERDNDARALAPLLEKLAAKLGPLRIGRLQPRPNHLPERAQAFAGVLAADEEPPPPSFKSAARPLRLLAAPLAVAAASDIPDGPPAWFRWQGTVHRIVRAEGPERIALDWWQLSGWRAEPPTPPDGLSDALRDYWRVEDCRGARFWLYRDGPWRADQPERWYLHGVFA